MVLARWLSWLAHSLRDSVISLFTQIGLQECLKLTKAIQKTAETLQNIADLYDDHVSVLVTISRHLFNTA
jgi:hypothetical protein